MYLSKQNKIRNLSKYIKLIDTVLLEVSQKNNGLAKSVNNSLKNGGKRVRPVISLLMCEVFCGDYRPAIPIAISYELAHIASLIQDDIFDGSEIRRGQSSIHKEFGIEKAILTSDFLIFEIFNQLSDYENWNIEPKRLYMILKLLSESSKSAVIGENLQLEIENSKCFTDKEYLKMSRQKTGSLIAAPAASGAIIGGASEEEIDMAYDFGMNLGLAYQIQDDILDILGKPNKMGKPVFQDIKKRNNNILTVYSQNNCCEKEHKLINSILIKKNISQNDLINFRNILLQNGSVDYAINLASEKYNECRKTLRKFKPGPARHKLLEITYLLSNRAYSESILKFRHKFNR